jgi:hypothetical protein
MVDRTVISFTSQVVSAAPARAPGPTATWHTTENRSNILATDGSLPLF